MEIFKLFGSIFVDNDKANRSIHKTESLGEKAFKNLGKGITTLAKVGATGALAFATGVGVLTKKAIDNYAEYEQLVGGIETLFKGSSNLVMEYANNAYKTAGMSANKYMETVTSFSASLLQGLGGDTKKAAEVADMAITDMSDNANKMGTDISLIQNAYQGFAKQNYTMLDNLKLGFGGTKSEMERLLKEAEKISGVKYDISNLNDVYEAIHVIQEEMGITGTTAKEASSTLQGSFQMMKSAWDNLLTGMADPNQDIGVLIGNWVDSGVVVLNNLVPRIAETIPRVVQGLGSVIVTIGQQIPMLMQTLFPIVLSSGKSIIQSLFGYFQSIDISGLLGKAVEIVSSIGEKIKENLPLVTSKALDIIEGLVNNIATNLPIIITSGMELLHNFVQGIMNALPTLIERVPLIISKIANLINDNMPIILQKGFDIIVSIGLGLIQAIPTLIANIPTIINAIIDVWTAFNWLKAGSDVIDAIGNGIKNAGKAIKKTVSDLFNKVYEAMTHPMTKGKEMIKGIIDSIKGFFNFKFTWPHIPLPHFGITPKGWSVGDLLKGKIPTLGINWYAKGGILTEPTAFGVSPTGKLNVGGEAGDEAVAPIDVLLGYVRTAVNESNSGITELLQNLIMLLSDYLPQLANMRLVLDTGMLVGEIAPQLDEELGDIRRRKERN